MKIKRCDDVDPLAPALSTWSLIEVAGGALMVAQQLEHGINLREGFYK
jgi:hypothetical protein